jgi:hypothetical protein
MLKRVTPDRFVEKIGETVQVIAIASNNAGVEGARFRYGQTILNAETINGHPGCTFIVAEGRARLQGVVAFFKPAPNGARYDLFEVDPHGVVDLEEGVTALDPDPVVSFVIEGVAQLAAAPVFAAAAPASRIAGKKAKTRRRKAGKKKAAKRKSARASRRKAGRGSR